MQKILSSNRSNRSRSKKENSTRTAQRRSEDSKQKTNSKKANLKTSFTQKLGYYSDQEIEFVKGELTNKNRYNVHAIIKNKSENYPLIFKFHPANGSDYLIYDVDILGVSIIQSYRSQFSDLSQSAGFNEITKRLQSVSLDNNTTTK